MIKIRIFDLPATEFKGYDSGKSRSPFGGLIYANLLAVPWNTEFPPH
jgi:hypothetical protein